MAREAQRLEEDLIDRLIACHDRGTRYGACWSCPRSACRLWTIRFRNKLLIRILDLFRRRRFGPFTSKEPCVNGDEFVEAQRNRWLVNRRHRAFAIIRPLHPKANHHIAVGAGMRFWDVLSRRRCCPAARTRLLLDRISLAGVTLAIPGIFKPLQRTRRNPEQAGYPLAEEALPEPMAEEALYLAEPAFRTHRPDSPD